MTVLKRTAKAALACIGCLLILISFAPRVSANEPPLPNFTIILKNAPWDTEIVTPDNFRIKKVFSLFEPNIYRYYESTRNCDEGLKLYLLSNDEKKEVIIPDEALEHVEKYVIIDYRTLAVRTKQPLWRTPLLIALRVSLTLLCEGVVLFLFGMWIPENKPAFFTVNIITQTFLNCTVITPVIYVTEMFVIMCDEVIIFIVETIVFCRSLRAPDKVRLKKLYIAGYTVLANIVSLIAGILAMALLPF